jgi:hypothetical protein
MQVLVLVVLQGTTRHQEILLVPFLELVSAKDWKKGERCLACTRPDATGMLLSSSL